jgi:CRP-like cAMP-binding protein
LPAAEPSSGGPPEPVDIVHCLRQAGPLRGLTGAALAELASRMRCEVHRRGELYLDPAALERFYVVLRGQVSFYRLASDGRKLTMDIKRAGDVYWFAARDWPAGLRISAEVLSDDTLLGCLALPDVRRLMMVHPSFALALFDEVCGVARRLADRVEELAHESVAVRLAHTLATRARASEQQVVTETHDELAWLTGASRARVTKELQRLRQAGLIAYAPHHHGIRVLDPERLGAL